MQRVTNLVFLLALLLVTQYSNATTACKTNFFDTANAVSSGVAFSSELSVGGVVVANRIIPNNPAANVSARINAASGDVGKLAEIFFVARYNGDFYMKTSQGWKAWDQQLQSLLAFDGVHTLSPTEAFDIERQLALPGDFEVYTGYCLPNGDMQYLRVPLIFTIAAPAKPDLRVSLLISPEAKAFNASQLLLKATVSNSGYATEGGTVLHCYRSNDAVIDSSDTEVYRVNVPALAPDATIVKECKTSANIPGTYYYGACVDTIANEDNMTNNCSIGVPFTVAPTLICALPQVLENGVCVTPTPTCPYALVNGQCITPNSVPIANAASVSTNQNTAKNITLSGFDADGDSFTYGKVTDSAHGSVSINGNVAIYTPAVDYSGVDSFSYKVNDGKAESAPAVVTITVQAVVVVNKRNDSGITSTQCYGIGGNALIDCALELAKNLSRFQDGMLGRDATRYDNSDGRAGFSFSKVCNNGDLAGKGTCPINPELGNASNAWGCTKDNVTGLIWEIKTNDTGSRDEGRVYYNYSAKYNPDRLYGDWGKDAGGFVNAVNAAGLCGASDWRLPTVDELQSIVDYGIASSGLVIDTSFFPNTARNDYWSSSSFTGGDVSVGWQVSFANGTVSRGCRGCLNDAVRLVRAGN
jgi:hypothetical protein